MELKFANEILNVNGIFIDKCTATGKYFWMVYIDCAWVMKSDCFDTIQEAFDDALDYLAEN